MREEVLLRWHGLVQPKEGVVLHAHLPEVLAGSVAHHVEAQQRLSRLTLRGGTEEWRKRRENTAV